MTPLKKVYEDEDELIAEFCSRRECRECLSNLSSKEPTGVGCGEIATFLDNNLKLIRFDKKGELV